jgi:hypothetical protein
MITRILQALFLAALPALAMAHDEHSSGSTQIELYELELTPDEKLKLSHLTIYSENERHDEQGLIDTPPPPPAQLITTENTDRSLIAL